jgi:hypothetical protein
MQDLRAGSPVSAAQPGSPGREGRGPPRPPGGDLTSPGVPKAAGNASGDNLGAGRSLPGPGWAEPTCCSFAQRGLFWKVSAERSPRQRQWRPQIHRKCTDPAWLLLFFLFWTGLVRSCWAGMRLCVPKTNVWVAQSLCCSKAPTVSPG